MLRAPQALPVLSPMSTPGKGGHSVLAATKPCNSQATSHGRRLNKYLGTTEDYGLNNLWGQHFYWTILQSKATQKGMRSTSKQGKDLTARLFRCCWLPAAYLLRLFLALHNQRGTGSWCTRKKKTSRGTSLWPSFQVQPCESLCFYIQLWRSSSSQGHPTPWGGTQDTHCSLHQQSLQLAYLSFSATAS